mgnify:CR=1 FL=1
MKNIRKHFDGLEVLEDISFSVDSGEVVSIIGPSGSGKSTLLRCATFLETIDSGEINYMGTKAAWTGEDGKAEYLHKNELRKVKSWYGLVFQQFNLFPHYTVLKNLMDAPIHIQKREKKEVEEEARALLKRMGLEDKADAYPCQLSGGQQQRVAIARAVVFGPKMILADEPTGNLDSKNGLEVMSLLTELNREGTTVVMVTHSDRDANMAHRIIHLFDGHIVKKE